eukprot:scaffold1504_cov34-Tisochrysis_lutea.AAC.1
MERASLPPPLSAHPAAPTDQDMTDAGHASLGNREPRPEPSHRVRRTGCTTSPQPRHHHRRIHAQLEPQSWLWAGVWASCAGQPSCQHGGLGALLVSP